MQKYESIADVPLKYRWDLSDYFESNDEFLKTFESTKGKIENISSFVGCTKDSNKLLEFLEYDTDVVTNIDSLGIFAYTNHDTDLSNDTYTNFLGMVDDLETKYSIEMAFFEPELLSLSEEEYNRLFDNDKLLNYKFYLDKIYRRKKHSISEAEEVIVASLTSTLNSYEDANATLLSNNHNYGTVTMEDGTEETVMTTNYRKLMKMLPRDKRKALFEQFNKVKAQYASTNATFLNNYVKTEAAVSGIYKYNSSWERSLFNENLSSKIFDTLVEVCKSRKSVISDFEKLKAKVLGVDKIMPWDAALELYKIDREYTIEDAQDMCLKAVSVLGDDYVDHFKRIIDDRCVDYCQYKGKNFGGYNVSGGKTKNSKIFMSFNNDLYSVSTLAHEGGHHVHHQYIYENNEEWYRNVSSLVGEVASLTNECLLSNYLIKNGTKEEALAGLSNLIDVIDNNLFGAAYDGEMERRFYSYVESGGTLTSDYMRKLQKECFVEFIPHDDVLHEYQLNTWLSIQHHFMFFYMFSYAICVSCATNVASEILNGNKEMLVRYKEFLKAGSDKWPMEAFKILGIDLEDRKVYENAIDYYQSLIKQFNELYDEQEKVVGR